MVIGTSSFLRKYSHGKSMEMITKTALEVIAYVKSQGVEVRFSSEDSFRSDLVDLLTLYKAVDKAGVNRVSDCLFFHIDDTTKLIKTFYRLVSQILCTLLHRPNLG